jgi:hypothetical protein
MFNDDSLCGVTAEKWAKGQDYPQPISVSPPISVVIFDYRLLLID